MQIVDLSVLLNEQTPVYPGDPSPKIESAGLLEKDGFRDHLISLGTHIGTHVDAPMHMIEDGISLDQVSVDQFVGHGCYIKVDQKFDIDKIRSAGIQPNDIVLFDTGMSDYYYEASYFEKYPVMSEEIADYLVSQKVKMVGFDTGSADIADGFPIHKILLGSKVLIIENLTNLASLAHKEFMVYALPLKLNIDGSPARVIAVIQ